MSATRGTFKDGKIILDGPPPADWPDGARVIVEPDPADEVTEEIPQRDDPASIARWLAWYESLEPFLSEEDEAGWQEARRRQKEWELANWDRHAKEVEDLFR